MSITYNISEHLVIENTEIHDYERRMTIDHLATLGSYILRNRAYIENLQIISDNETLSFSGATMTQAYHEMLNETDKASSLEIRLLYEYTVCPPEAEAGPFEMMEHLEGLMQEDSDALNGLFYSVYNYADCGDGAGVLAAYGKKNHTLYTGEVPYVAVNSIPDGQWYAPHTAVVCDVDSTDDVDFAQIEKICREMSRFSEADSLRVTDKMLSFALNNLRIKNDAELKTFLQLYAQLFSLAGDNCGLIGEMADTSTPDARVIHFDVDVSGAYTLEMAAIS